MPFIELARRYNVVLRERDALRIELNEIRYGVAVTHDTIKALRAKIEQMERQEPVAFALYSGLARKAVYLSEIEACEQRDRRQLTADLGGSLEAYRVVPLYLAPGAQPAPSMPFPDIYVSDTGHAWDAKLNSELRHSPNATPYWAQPAPSIPEGWKLVPTAESRHPGIYKMLSALHVVDNTPGASEWESYAAFLAVAPEVKS